MVDDQDLELLERVSDFVHQGLSDSQAIQFFATLSVSEYDRLIVIFTEDEESGLSRHTRDALIKILKKLRDAKHGTQ